jgi:hypothetical protein
MADERDPDISRKYRELGAEEPPRALDERILAASRQELRKRNWYGPVAIAAVLTLVVAVTVQVERQRPDDEFVAQAPPPVPASAPAQQKEELPLKEEPALKTAPAQVKPAAPAPSASSRGFTPDPKSSVEAPAVSAPARQPAVPTQPSADALRDLAKLNEGQVLAERARPADERVRAQVQARQDAAEARRVEPEPQAKLESSGSRGSAAPPVPAAAAQAKPAPAFGAVASGAMLRVNPERWLEDIAELRKEGKHDDADKLLAEFRKTYPDYRISDEMRAKVEKK